MQQTGLVLLSFNRHSTEVGPMAELMPVVVIVAVAFPSLTRGSPTGVCRVSLSLAEFAVLKHSPHGAGSVSGTGGINDGWDRWLGPLPNLCGTVRNSSIGARHSEQGITGGVYVDIYSSEELWCS
jgi:hypothetical protein